MDRSHGGAAIRDGRLPVAVMSGFLGAGKTKQQAIRAGLNACFMPLPKDGRVDTQACAELPDPFPAWQPDAR
jgi:hypothetical protein